MRRRDRQGEPAGIGGILEYAADLFDAVTAEAVAGRLVRVLEQVAADPGVRVSQVDVLHTAERRRLLTEGNGTAVPVPDQTLAGLFEAQAARTPDAVAVACGAEVWTYRGLGEWSGRLARVPGGAGGGS